MDRLKFKFCKSMNNVKQFYKSLNVIFYNTKPKQKLGKSFIMTVKDKQRNVLGNE